MNLEPLFTPFKYKGLELRNRFVMAPMTRSQSPDGVPNQAVTDYYSRRAQAEVGLILTEGTVINRPGSKNLKDIPDFHGQQALQAWKGIIDNVHAAGAAMAPQIWHVGNEKPATGYLPAAWKAQTLCLRKTFCKRSRPLLMRPARQTA